MISAKMATLGLLKIEVRWTKGHDVISVHDVTNRNLSRDSSYIVDVVMWSSLKPLLFLQKKLP